MTEEQTLMLIKPDGVKNGHIGDVISRIEHRNYEITAMKMVQATESQLREHYAALVDKPFFPKTLKYMQSGPIIALIIKGTNVIAAIREMSGATVPSQARSGTLRGDFAREWPDGTIRNLVHTSDSPESAQREIGIWF
ncbi:nucleoside-diphosphate kinase [Agrilactobacillus fermenti]|uniref:nucleoside-diphosphate kinase n=1 Tax=Agrilactobacillus fermenti TaxID=2586909 RepID=UPI003A5C67A9